jgi:NAD(P)-dependent dehydrogenase (short-subunit alcohol dehydrogenase family)
VKEFRGRTAVITGGASGIGLAMARRFATEGMNLALADIERPVLQGVVDEFNAAGTAAIGVPTDVSDAEQVQALAAAAFERFGEVHIVCNNAGVGSRGLTINDLPLADFQWVIGVNLYGVIHGIQAFLPHMRANNEGHFVNTASISGLHFLPRMAPYNATKAAVVALSETLKFELDAERSNVGVSVLCPSWVRTNISTSQRNQPERFAYQMTTEQAAEMAEYKARRRAQLTGEALEPSDVAEQVFQAVVDNRFYVITHRESIEPLRERFARIVAGENPVEPPQ